MSWSWDDLKIAQQNDKEIGCIVRWLTENEKKQSWNQIAMKSVTTKTLWHMWPRLTVRDGILKRKVENASGKDEIWQIVLPANHRDEFLRLAHSSMTGGHLGFKISSTSVQNRAYWPTWSSDLYKYIKACEPCARYHRGSIRHQD